MRVRVWALWRMSSSLSRGQAGRGGLSAAAAPGPAGNGAGRLRGPLLPPARPPGAHAGMHTLPLGGALPRGTLGAPGAAAAREVQRLARGGAPLLAIPLVRRKLHAAAHSLASEEAAVTAAAAAPPGRGTGGAGLAPVGAAATAAGVPACDEAAGAAGASSSGSAADSAASSGTGLHASGLAGTGSASASPSSSSSASGGEGAAVGGGSGATSSSASSASSREPGGGAAPSPSGSSSGAAPDGGGAPGPAPRGPAALPFLMHSGASMLPHPDKAHRGGEDAFFISEPPLAVGVADGVGGWAEIGVDAGAYARLFMAHAREEAEALIAAGGGSGGSSGSSASSSAGGVSPQSVLERAYYRTNVQGSSTVCILALNGSTLCASNLGDSGFVLVRDGAPAFQSPQQQHNFNFPYQLGSADGGASDHPQSAMRFELTVQPGDIIITGTDGLWDNVFAEEAAAIAARCKAQGDGPEAAAHTLCRCGRGRARRPWAFCTAAARAWGPT
jgi:protein phosphatase PTC7